MAATNGYLAVTPWYRCIALDHLTLGADPPADMDFRCLIFLQSGSMATHSARPDQLLGDK
jgi:hypothetical protein